MDVKWSLKPYSLLSLDDLYDILSLRCQVFIVEQVPYQDIDGLDNRCNHLFARDSKGMLVAYLRIIPPGIAFDHCGIGRVCVRKEVRRQGLASKMLDIALSYLDSHGENIVKISAQRYLLSFYHSKGFEPVGEEYLEDGIPHIVMERKRVITEGKKYSI